ncbi:MAG TPA: vitamin K epoxide reductase family protein, partial [Geothrix sp.]
AVCIAGLVIAGYLTWEHFTGATTFACPQTGTINCVKVTTSSYSSIVGVPVALLGLLYFGALTLMCLPAAWRSPLPFLRALRLGSVTTGVLRVLYLLWAELFRIDAICLWCTAIHILTIALLAIIAITQALSGPLRSAPAAARGGSP